MKMAGLTVLGAAAMIFGCAEARFYSFPALKFVRVAEIPVRNELVGTWRASDGHVLVLLPDGKFKAPRLHGCWDVDGSHIELLRPCVNYGSREGDPAFALAEAIYRCGFTLGERLVLKDCTIAGEYRREVAGKNTDWVDDPVFIPRASDVAASRGGEALIGRWRSAAGSVLTLSADGKFQTGNLNGCWKKQPTTIIFKMPCANQYPKPNDAILTLAEYLYPCPFALTARLTLKDCFATGEYRREVTEKR